MGARRLAAHCLRLLDAPPATVLVMAPHDRGLAAALVARGARVSLEAAGAAVVSFRGDRADPAARQGQLSAVRRRLPAGARLVLVDHNQPRGRTGRVLAAALLALRGVAPSRARYPAARELAALGLVVERLRLACGERVQLVLGRLPD